MSAAHVVGSRINATSHRIAIRQQIERAIETALDVANRLIARLDAMDGDPDLEGDADREVDADCEPARAALVTHGSQIRWVGYDDLADCCSLSPGGPA